MQRDNSGTEVQRERNLRVQQLQFYHENGRFTALQMAELGKLTRKCGGRGVRLWEMRGGGACSGPEQGLRETTQVSCGFCFKIHSGAESRGRLKRYQEEFSEIPAGGSKESKFSEFGDFGPDFRVFMGMGLG
jgi:hypothetical protein